MNASESGLMYELHAVCFDTDQILIDIIVFRRPVLDSRNDGVKRWVI